MNAPLPPTAADGPALDATRPWPGLASFTEATSAWFRGREAEVAELLRRIERRRLTVLFGQSGLGKTSMLQAGIVPRLRGLGLRPVTVRLDLSPDAPEPATQVLRALMGSAASPDAPADTTLWEACHRRPAVLPPGPVVLILDQFEELFTLAPGDATGRARVARFVTQLADLVENRPPEALARRLDEGADDDADDAAAAQYDFARDDCRVLISLREDWLAELEALKTAMPSVTQNRQRVAPMTGAQAMDAVRGPGGRLVDDAAAEAIVRFVAGGAELAHAQVEPALLGLILRELNDQRLAQGRDRLTADLLAGTHAAILRDFYERCLADQPAALRRFIEDELLTDSGFRENLAEERVRREFAAAGAAPGALEALVDRRLLRIEERLDRRRVELTHDVLCGVVQASREARREHEALAAADLALRQQREQAAAARAETRHARRVATLSTLLAALAVVAGGFAWVQAQRARASESAAVQARAAVDQARTESQGLLGYLLDDFQEELEPLGRLDLAVQLDRRALAYYDALPPALQNRDTRRGQALAQVRTGAALASQGHYDDATPLLAQAVAQLRRVRAEGDDGEAARVGLALGLRAQSRLLLLQARLPQAADAAAQALALVDGPASAAGASRALRVTQARALLSVGILEDYRGGYAAATVALRRSQQVAGELAARGDPVAAATQLDAVAYLMDALVALGGAGPEAEAAQVGNAALQQADALLQLRPGHATALANRALIHQHLGHLAFEQDRVADAQREQRAATDDWTALTRRDPSVARNWFNLGDAFTLLAGADMAAGQPAAAAAHQAAALAAMDHAPDAGVATGRRVSWSLQLQAVQLERGDLDGARATQQAMQGVRDGIASHPPADATQSLFADCAASVGHARLALAASNPASAGDPAFEALQRLRPRVDAGFAGAGRDAERLWECRVALDDVLARAALAAGQDAAAAQAWQAQAAPPPEVAGIAAPSVRRVRLSATVSRAFALARAGQRAAAREALADVHDLARGAAPADAQALRFQRARLAFVAALASDDSAARARGAAEALSQVDALAPEWRATTTVRTWRGYMAAARR